MLDKSRKSEVLLEGIVVVVITTIIMMIGCIINIFRMARLWYSIPVSSIPLEMMPIEIGMCC